jgi:hypothetical protein
MVATIPRYKELPDLKPLAGERKEQVYAMRARIVARLQRLLDAGHGNSSFDELADPSANP